MKTPHELMLEQLKAMSHEDMKKMLANDPLYKAVLSSAPESDRAKIETIAFDFLSGWKENAFDKIIAMASNPDFVRELMKMFEQRAGETKMGDII